MDHVWIHFHTHTKYIDEVKNCITFLHVIALLKLIMKTLLKLIHFSFMSKHVGLHKSDHTFIIIYLYCLHSYTFHIENL